MAGDRDPKNPVDGMLAIPATHYMEYNPSTGTYRAKITLDSKLGSFLGINAMMGHAFFYDLSKDRIGFAESYNCKPRLGMGGFVDDDMFYGQDNLVLVERALKRRGFDDLMFCVGEKILNLAFLSGAQGCCNSHIGFI